MRAQNKVRLFRDSQYLAVNSELVTMNIVSVSDSATICKGNSSPIGPLTLRPALVCGHEMSSGCSVSADGRFLNGNAPKQMFHELQEFKNLSSLKVPVGLAFIVTRSPRLPAYRKHPHRLSAGVESRVERCPCIAVLVMMMKRCHCN